MSVNDFEGAMLEQLKVAVEAEQRTIQESMLKIKKYRAAITAIANPSEVGLADDDGVVPTGRRVHMGSAAHLLRKHVVQLLLAEGRPLSRAEILEGLAAKGVKLDVKDPAKRISKIMWDAKEFQHLPNGYWFTDGAIEAKSGARSAGLPL